MTPETLTLNLAGGVRIVVPADLAALSTFVFLEQEDWFEDEAAFLRRLARPGLRMLDIGANLGFYALTACAAAGGQATIFAFGPTPEIAALLSRSAALNGCGGLQVVATALGAEGGRIGLARSGNSELNRVAAGAAAESVPIARLDDLVAQLDVSRCDFVKIDVEGSELAVIEGGAGFFARESPLVMFEITDGRRVDLAAGRRLEALGYALYELMLEPPMLVPAAPPLDRFRLNLFACKPDRAALLEDAGLLARRAVDAPPADRSVISELVTAPAALRSAAAAMRRLVEALDPADPHARALGFLAAARQDAAGPAARLGALRAAQAAAEEAVAAKPSLPRLVTAARIARIVGRRGRAVELAGRLVDGVLRGAHVQIDEPFVPMLASYESWTADGGIGAWMSAMTIEALWRWRAFSDLFDAFQLPQGHPADVLRGFGREAPEFERRRQLTLMRRGAQARPMPHPLLARGTADNLNPGFWTGGGPTSGG